MRVEVELRGSLAGRAGLALPGGRGRLDLAEGSTVARLAGVLGLPPGGVVFVVNGAAATGGTALADGDRVQAFPMAAGG